MAPQFMSPSEAAQLIKSGDYVCVGGLVSLAHPEAMTDAVVARFETTGEPNGVTIITGAGMFATDRWAREGLTAQHITSHIGLAPNFSKLIHGEKIDAQFLPFGPITHLIRAIGSKKPGILTKIGLGTFMDPEFGGGKMNKRSKKEYIEKLKVNGEDYLFYKAFPINVTIIKGTTADENGNISTENESVCLDQLCAVLAARACGGKVIAQVERIALAGTIHPKQVKIPGILVDAVVVVPPEKHWQLPEYNKPELRGDIKVPLSTIPPMPLDARKIVARRAAMELVPNAVINLGIGIPMGVASIAAEEGMAEDMTIAMESGVIGGVPLLGAGFGAVTNPEAIIDFPYMLDLFNSGTLDVTVLGLAEVDSLANVNVSKFGPTVVGPGGFIDISQSTPVVVFAGAMTAGGLEVQINNGKVEIVKEGRNKKFIKSVEQITFSGEVARRMKPMQKILYVTERAVFDLRDEGLTLIEIAPGIDLEKDILQQMEFKPNIAGDLKTIDPRVYVEGPMGIRDEILNKGK